MNERRLVETNVKDERLIKIRREQMIKAAISLFKEKGFHRTTTREIAKHSGFSIGTLYEYIRSKEDILYLVCDQIYEEVQLKIQQEIDFEREVSEETLRKGIDAYFRIMDEMQDEVLVLYQEAKSLPKDRLRYVLGKELQMVAIFEKLIQKYVQNAQLHLEKQQIQLLAHNIIVQGQMWGFRRWSLQKLYSLDTYIHLQTENLITSIKGLSPAAKLKQ